MSERLERLDKMSPRDIRQRLVADWCTAAFGEEQTDSVENRAIKLLEEANEAAQAAGVTREMAHKLVDYVYGRPVGELWQELGGVGVTLLALANAAGLSADEEEVREVARVLSKPLEVFRARNAAKVAAGLVPSGQPAQHPDAPQHQLCRVCFQPIGFERTFTTVEGGWAHVDHEPRSSSRPVRNSKTGRVSRHDAEMGDRIPGRDYPGLSWEEWMASLRAGGWDEYAADGWLTAPVRWVRVKPATA